jgi:hypothetical protein
MSVTTGGKENKSNETPADQRIYAAEHHPTTPGRQCWAARVSDSSLALFTAAGAGGKLHV